MEFPGIMFIILLNVAPPLTPARSAAPISILPRLVPVQSPTASTTPLAAEITAPHGPSAPIPPRIPSRTALSPSERSLPDIPPNKDPAPDNILCVFCDIPVLLP
jgi:hypothetical protein